MVTTRKCSVYTREAMTARLPFRRPAAEPVNVIFYCQDSYGLGLLRLEQMLELRLREESTRAAVEPTRGGLRVSRP
jgi:hypothetical protein